MKIDSIAAAFGLFQLAFAHMTCSQADALVKLRQSNNPKLTFEDVFKMPFNRMSSEFKNELKQFNKDSTPEDHLGKAHDSLRRMGEIAQWRNERIHVRVVIASDDIALFNWRTGERLAINNDECRQKTREALKVSSDLEAAALFLDSTLQEWSKYVDEKLPENPSEE